MPCLKNVLYKLRYRAYHHPPTCTDRQTSYRTRRLAAEVGSRCRVRSVAVHEPSMIHAAMRIHLPRCGWC